MPPTTDARRGPGFRLAVGNPRLRRFRRGVSKRTSIPGSERSAMKAVAAYIQKSQQGQRFMKSGRCDAKSISSPIPSPRPATSSRSNPRHPNGAMEERFGVVARKTSSLLSQRGQALPGSPAAIYSGTTPRRNSGSSVSVPELPAQRSTPPRLASNRQSLGQVHAREASLGSISIARSSHFSASSKDCSRQYTASIAAIQQSSMSRWRPHPRCSCPD